MDAPTRCPSCGAPLGGIATTAEFAVPNLADLANLGVAEGAPGGASIPGPRGPAAGPTTCSWCGRAEAEVRKLLTGAQGVRICDGCVALCYEILQSELGDWPPPP